MPKIITIANNKGGVGKTTTAQNLAAGLAAKGHITLAIDFDSQANLTSIFNLETIGIDLKTALATQKTLNPDKWSKTIKDNLFLIPNYGDTDYKLFHNFEVYDQLFVLRDIMPTEGVDFIVIDTPPNIELQTFNAIMVSDYIVIPVEYDAFSVAGLQGVLNKIEHTKKRHNLKVEIAGVLVTQVDERMNLNNLLQTKLEKDFKDKLFTSYIRTNANFRKAQIMKEDIFKFSDARGIEDYSNFTEELLKIIC